jgi:hypothetical protein
VHITSTAVVTAPSNELQIVIIVHGDKWVGRGGYVCIRDRRARRISQTVGVISFPMQHPHCRNHLCIFEPY